MSEKEVHMAKYEDGELKSPAKVNISAMHCTVKLKKDKPIKSEDLVSGEIGKENSIGE